MNNPAEDRQRIASKVNGVHGAFEISTAINGARDCAIVSPHLGDKTDDFTDLEVLLLERVLAVENIRALDIVVNPIDDDGAEAVDGALDHARFRARGGTAVRRGGGAGACGCAGVAAEGAERRSGAAATAGAEERCRSEHEGKAKGRSVHLGSPVVSYRGRLAREPYRGLKAP